MEGEYNLRNPAVKRLMKEAAELRNPTELYHAQPLEDNLFEWHFSVRGPPDTEFDGGVYHGRIILPPDYPMKPPSIYILTPNGRFEVNKKICLSISGHHPESWQPSWSIRTALLAIIGFMPTHGGGAIGSLDYSPEERRKLAKKSMDWVCHACLGSPSLLKELTQASAETSAEAREIAKQVAFKDESEVRAEQSRDSTVHKASEELPSSQEVPSPPEVEETATTVRQRRIVREVRPVEPVREAQQSQMSGNLVMIIIVSLMIAALLFRRFYILNEWRFHEPPSSTGEL